MGSVKRNVKDGQEGLFHSERDTRGHWVEHRELLDCPLEHGKSSQEPARKDRLRRETISCDDHYLPRG